MSARTRKHQVYALALWRAMENRRSCDYLDLVVSANLYWDAVIRELEDGTYGKSLSDWRSTQ